MLAQSPQGPPPRGLMPAEQPLCVRVANVSRVAGEVDAGIERHDLASLAGDLVA